MTNPTHIMVDLETLGTKPGCVILSIGAIPFDPVAGTVDLMNHFYVNIDRDSAEALGLTVDPETEAWWQTRSNEAKQALTHDPRPLSEALDSFAAWMAQHDSPRFWANDPDFDGTILGAAFDAAQLKRPWPYNAARSCRTMAELTGIKPDRTEGTHHNALDDCLTQAKAVIAAYEALRLSATSQAGQTALIHDLRDANTRAHNRNVALSHALSEAVAQFRIYEAHHLAKGTEESTAKAKVNHDLAARLEAVIKGQGTDLSATLQDPAVVHINMLRGGIAKLTPEQIGHLYRGHEAAEVVSELTRQQGVAVPKEQEPVGKVVLFGGDLKEIAWRKGRLPPVGAKLYTHPAPASDELLEALEPFAKAAKIRLCGEWQDDQRFWNTDAASHLTFGDLRRAERLYDKHKGPRS